MSDTGNDSPDAPDHKGADDLFAVAARRPEPTPAATPEEPADPTDPADPEVDSDGAADDRGVATEADDLGTAYADTHVTSAESPFPDGAGPATREPVEPPAADPTGQPAATGVGRYRPPRPGSFGYHTPPPSAPDGGGGYRAGAYPAGPPMPTQPQFGRRAPQRGPRPDANGFYPSEYYLGTDWTRVVVGGLAATVLILGLVAAGMYLFDRFDPRDDVNEIAVATPASETLIPVFACAGDADKVTDMTPPQAFLITGRDAGNRWLAFRNPQSGRRQLWIRASSLPTFDASTVGVVSCASSDTEFPTPLSGPTPAATPAVDLGEIPTPTP